MSILHSSPFSPYLFFAIDGRCIWQIGIEESPITGGECEAIHTEHDDDGRGAKG